MRESFIAIAVVMLMASCSRGDAVRKDDDAASVTEISVVTEPLVTADSTTRADDGGVSDSDATEDIEDMTADNKFDGESLLYISQMGTTLDPDFNNEASENLYIYRYYENELANWEQNYNFKTERERQPIKWPVIKSNGSVGNTFSLYALHFPVDNQVRFSVERNQKELDKFRKSDIMGAYHATSALYTRLRFKLYHLMFYLRVTIYVPVYQEPDDKSQSTGFYADAVKNAFLKNVCTDFEISWRVNRSSDNDAPFVMSKNPKSDYVFMYGHPSNEENKQIHIKNIRSSFFKDNIVDEDDVYVYNFSVLIPPQTIGTNEPFMQFQLLPANSAFDKDHTDLTTYYFQSSQLVQGLNEFQPTQGALEHLTLYLPRRGNDAILVSADIVDWTDASSDMTVTKQPNGGSGENGGGSGDGGESGGSGGSGGESGGA